MSMYQRYISRFLIFFSSIFVIFLLCIESNVGFKFLFNYTSRFFLGLRAEEISGNWRNFTLKNIYCDLFGLSIQANNINIVLDTKSLFNISTIIKTIETKNLIVSLKKNILNHTEKKNILNHTEKKNIFVKYPIIFQKIHADTILFKTPKENIFLSNVSSGIKLMNKSIIFFPTYVDAIYVKSSNFYLKKKSITNTLTIKNNIFNAKKIHNFLHFFSKIPRIHIPLNIYFMSLKCKKINFMDYKNLNLFQIALKAEMYNNIFKINQVKIKSSFVKIQSYGKIIFNHDYSTSYVMNNKIFIPRFRNKIINVLFLAHLNNKLVFKLKYNNLYQTNVHGSVILDRLDHPFYIKLQSKNLFFSKKQNTLLQLKKLNIFLKGTINHYSLSLKNVLSIKDMPAIFVNIHGQGDLKNIHLKKIKFFPVTKKILHKKIINLEENIIYHQYILELMGNMHILGIKNNHIYNLRIPKIDLHGNIMKKKFSILGSLYYNNLDLLEIPGINLFLGKNKLYLKGSFGKKNNIYSSVYANHLDYFSPELKGTIKAQSNLSGSNTLPVVTSKILAKHLNWNNICLKSLKILTNINVKNIFLGQVLADVKKIYFSNFYIDSLYFHVHWNYQKQKFYFLLKNHELYINLVVNGAIDFKTGNWHGFLKKINIQTPWGKWNVKNRPSVHYYNSHYKIHNFYKKNIKIKNICSSFIGEIKKSLFEIFHQLSINFKSKLSFNTKLKWIPGENISNGIIFLTAHNLELEKKTKENIFFENIDFLKISMNLIKNDFKSQWVAKKSRNSLEENNMSGYLNIMNIYNKKNIEGKFILSDFPVSFINFFTTNFKQVQGTFASNINFFGTLYQPKILADVRLKDIFIKSDNILKYTALFFPYFLKKIEHIKINQEIIIKKSSILFTLNSILKDSNNIEWNLLFKSNKIKVLITPKIKVKFSSELNLHYLFSKYDLIGYIKFSFFYFKINEKDFIF